MDTFVLFRVVRFAPNASASNAGTSAKRTAPLLFSPSVDSHEIFRRSSRHSRDPRKLEILPELVRARDPARTGGVGGVRHDGVDPGIQLVSATCPATAPTPPAKKRHGHLRPIVHQPAMAKARDPFPGPAGRFPRKPRDESETRLASTSRPSRRAGTRRGTVSPREVVARVAHVLIAPRCGRRGFTIALSKGAVSSPIRVSDVHTDWQQRSQMGRYYLTTSAPARREALLGFTKT